MSKPTLFQTYQNEGFSATLYELAETLFLLVVKGRATSMADVNGTNDLLKAKLSRPHVPAADTHFIIDSTELLQIPEESDSFRKIFTAMSYLGRDQAGYVITLLQHRNFVVEAFLELASTLSGKLLKIKQATVFSSEAVVEFLQEHLPPSNQLWQNITPEEILTRLTELSPRTKTES
jgi:hypothetical protein